MGSSSSVRERWRLRRSCAFPPVGASLPPPSGRGRLGHGKSGAGGWPRPVLWNHRKEATAMATKTLQATARALVSRGYRQMLLTTKGIGDQTIRQATDDGRRV